MPTTKIKNLNERKMDDIIRSALREFAIRPYHDASYNRIIQGAGMGKGTMYYYFKSKKDLFTTIVNGVIQGIKPKSLDTTGIKTSHDYWTFVEQSLRHFFEFSQQQPLIFAVLQTNLFCKERSDDHPMARILRDTNQWLREFVLIGHDVHAIAANIPQDLAVKLTWSTWDAATQWCQDAHLEDQPALKANLLRSIFESMFSSLPAYQIPESRPHPERPCS